MKKRLPSFFDCIALLTITIILLFTGTVIFKIPISYSLSSLLPLQALKAIFWDIVGQK